MMRLDDGRTEAATVADVECHQLSNFDNKSLNYIERAPASFDATALIANGLLFPTWLIGPWEMWK